MILPPARTPPSRLSRIFPVLAAALIVAAGSLLAGPINPPAGPVASTNKTLQEVEPRTAINATNTPGDANSLFKITQPGSYYLTGNITGVAGKHGIVIVSSGVTLNLNGFDLVGVVGMGPFDGVSATVINLTNIAIRNGSVRNWGGDGIDLGTSTARYCTVSDVHANANTGSGITAGNGSIISVCAVSGNSATGISVGEGCSLARCTSLNNIGIGINAGNRCSITTCTATGNVGIGISTDGAVISDCTASGNSSTGINAGTDTTISHCNASDNSGNGIAVSLGCAITDSVTRLNSGAGMSGGTSSTITGCTSSANRGVGIQVGSGCRVNSCTCDANGNTGDSAGIHATGADNRIDGNNCTNADRGIDVAATGNIIIKNTCSGNTTDWVIAANNIYGPIIDRRIPLPVASTPAVSGPAAASTLGSTDPNANFTY